MNTSLVRVAVLVMPLVASSACDNSASSSSTGGLGGAKATVSSGATTSSTGGAGEGASTGAGGASSSFGVRLQKTMTKLATTQEEVRVLVYGQSISEQVWWLEVKGYLQSTFPKANLVMETHARGGCAADCLLPKLKEDVYDWNPDLIIFHVYGGEAEKEAIFKGMRENTKAELLIQQDHVDWRPQDGEPYPGTTLQEATDRYNWHAQHNTVWLPAMAEKYGFELAPMWTEWHAYLDEKKLKSKALLEDQIHLNDEGNKLMAKLIERHLVHRP